MEDMFGVHDLNYWLRHSRNISWHWEQCGIESSHRFFVDLTIIHFCSAVF